MKLYEIAQYINEIEGEEDEKAKKDTLQLLKLELKEKNTNIIKVVRNLESESEMIDKEIKRLRKLKKQRKKNIDRLKKYTLQALESINIERVDTPIGKIYNRESKRLIIDDVSKIPGSFVEIRQTEKVDKRMLKQAIEDGQDIKGAHIEIKNNLQIK